MFELLRFPWRLKSITYHLKLRAETRQQVLKLQEIDQSLPKRTPEGQAARFSLILYTGYWDRKEELVVSIEATVTEVTDMDGNTVDITQSDVISDCLLGDKY